jgi:four helix bundle protein
MSNDKVKTHKDLIVWQKAMDFVEEIYKLTDIMPKTELYGLTSQIRRSAISIPSNIAEGAARNHNKEFIQFLYVALGSVSELETQLLLAERLEFIPEAPIKSLSEIKRLLLGLIKAKKAGV